MCVSSYEYRSVRLRIGRSSSWCGLIKTFPCLEMLSVRLYINRDKCTSRDEVQVRHIQAGEAGPVARSEAAADGHDD